MGTPPHPFSVSRSPVVALPQEHGLKGSRWSLARQGYLLAPAYGYALALFAWARGETKPAWARELRPDIRHPFRQGLRYLLKTGDSSFQPQAPPEEAHRR